MSEELFPIVDLDGKVVGTATRKECHSGSMLLHPVVHLHIVDKDGNVLLQRRSINKDIQPGRWDTAVGGHVDYGEKVDEALRRESFEELGIKLVSPIPLLRYAFKSDREHELVNVFYIRVERENFTATHDPVEIDEIRFWTPGEIKDATGKGILTPNFEQEYNRIKGLLR